MKRIITISREFGSGGRSIGKEVAQKLGIGYYDKELIEKIAEETGLSKDFIEQNGEYARGRNILTTALKQLLEILVNGLQNRAITITNEVKSQLINWFVSQPLFIQALCPNFGWEV